MMEQSYEPAPEENPTHVPDEIINEILLFVPVKSLLRFRCVSKSWLSLISSPHFIRAHLSKSSNNNDYSHHRLIFHFYDSRKMFDEYGDEAHYLKHCSLNPVLYAPITEATNIQNPFRYKSRIRVKNDFQLVGSCNGLICVAVHKDKDIFLWNPAIRKSEKLPKLGYPDSMLVFYGFGYEESNDDYKVFRIRHYGIITEGQTWVDVYSRNTSSWKTIEDSRGGCPVRDIYYVNGKLHRKKWENFLEVGKIVSLDLTNEMYGEVEQPKYDEGCYEWTLQVIGGCLSLFCHYRSGHVHLWIMKEYGVKESWTKVILVTDLFNDPSSRYKPLFESKDGQILSMFKCRLALCDPKHESLAYPRIKNLEDYFDTLAVYVESLVLLNNHDRV